jgi:hypothetical protein
MRVKRSLDPREPDTANRPEQPNPEGAEEGEIDQILADSFPASDPPPWTLGVTQDASDGVRSRSRDEE